MRCSFNSFLSFSFAASWLIPFHVAMERANWEARFCQPVPVPLGLWKPGYRLTWKVWL